MLQKFLLIWLLLISATAFLWPKLELPYDPFAAAGGTGINGLIVVVMFCIGTLLPVHEVDTLIRQWPTVLAGTAIQYISMPLLAWTMVQIFRPDPGTAAGILIVGCVPGAMASNVLTLSAHGNVSYSVSLTTSATLLSPLVVPLILGFALSEDVNYNGAKAVQMLVLTIVLPVIYGHLLCRCLGGFSTAVLTASGIGANLAILAIIAIAVGLKRNALQEAAWTVVGILAIINAGGYLAGYFGGLSVRLPEPMRRALTLEVGMQNAGAGTALALHLFGEGSPAVVPCILYTFGCMLTGTILASVWHQAGPARNG
ncbi:MAG: bile acid:sodium symporter family protein [Fuerstiella sp.]|nr:bile acid:sodium symporter family protein [Fuerstiella sp.]